MPRAPIKVAKQKKALPRKRTHVRGLPLDPTQAQYAEQIKETIHIPQTQRELEEAIKYKDFEKVNRLRGYQQERTIISRSLQMLGLLRNGFADAYNKSLEYDPTLQLTKDIQEDSETMIKALDELLSTPGPTSPIFQKHPSVNSTLWSGILNDTVWTWRRSRR